MSDDPHPCMKVTSHIRNFLTMTVAAVEIQEQNVPQITSDDESYSSILILSAEDITALNLNHKKINDLRPYLVAPKKSAQRLRVSNGESNVFARRFLMH